MSSTIDQAREWLGRITQSFSPSTLTFAGLLLAALFPIYCGSHASLSLPSSAAPSAKKSRSAGDSKDASEAEDDDDDLDEAEDDVTSVMSGLQPQDALWFPLAGGLALGGLYVLIKWLEDPALLNKLLNWYFSFLAIVSVRQLLADSLGVATSFVFPQRYRDGSALWRVERGARLFVMEPRGGGGSDDAAAAPAAGGGGARHQDRKLRKPSPFPGLLSRVGLFPALWRWCWAVREALTEKYALHITLRGRKLVRTRFGANDVLGLTASLLAVVAYNFVGQPWWLMNVLSFGLSYNALQLISPRTFWTGTLVLSTLFLYDIYMVFFT
jgi:minor histocompatibility antigen H13